MDRASLERAYRNTTYRAAGFEIRVDALHPALDRAITEHGLIEWAYLSACDPGSVPLPARENARRHALLLERVERLPAFPGEASADAGDWPPEPSVLVLGLAASDAEALAREFGQNAFIFGAFAGRAQLVWVDRPRGGK